MIQSGNGGNTLGGGGVGGGAGLGGGVGLVGVIVHKPSFPVGVA